MITDQPSERPCMQMALGPAAGQCPVHIAAPPGPQSTSSYGSLLPMSAWGMYPLVCVCPWG